MTLKKISEKLIIFSILAVFSGYSISALAESATPSVSNTYAGVLLGVGAYNNNAGNNFLYGVEGGYKFMPQWSVGLGVMNSSLSVISPLSANLLMILGNLKYYTEIGGLNFGVKTGVALNLYSGTGAPSTSSNFTVGPSVGYDYIFSGNWSAGVDVAYLWITSSPSLGVFQGCAALKYAF